MKQRVFRVGTTSDLYMDTSDKFGKSLPEAEAVKRLAKVGFEALDYGIFWHQDKKSPLWKPDWRSYVQNIAEAAKESGIVFSQAHAPMFNRLGPDGDEMFDFTLRSFEIAQILGAPYLVVHPQFWGDSIYGNNHDELLAYNLKFYASLLDASAKTGVKIALENMFGYDPEKDKLCPTYFSYMADILELLDRTEGREQFVVCLDVGHANIIGEESVSDCIRKLDKNLKLLHLHDNFGKNDDHMPPFNGNIDWKDTIHALREVDYDGVLSLEAQSLCHRMPASNDALRQAAVELTYQTVKEIAGY